jgi:hypothetical protein
MTRAKEYKFDFCTIQRRDDNILVFEINEGVEVSAEMAAELTRAANEAISEPFGILSNRINSYSLSFEAITALAQYDNLAALAIVVHDAKSRMLVETQNYFISTLKKMPIRIFMDIDPAIDWLKATLQNPAQPTPNDLQTNITPTDSGSGVST